MSRSLENARAWRIKSSPSMAVSIAARSMKAVGEDVIDLSVGEPDFDTPPHIVEAAVAAMRSGQTRYTEPNGTEVLREAIVDKFLRENGLTYSVSDIAIGSGAKQILFNAFLATLEPGDEVIMPAPFWVSYPDIVALHGGSPIVIPCGIADGFKITPEALVAALTPRTRWLLLNSPGNPGGSIYSANELAALGQVLGHYPEVLVMSDEIYEHIVGGNVSFVSVGAACPQLRDRLLIVNGVSKAYAMTGWRLGYAAGPKALVAVLNKMESQSTTCPCSISQAAAIAALTGPQDFVRSAAAEYQARGTLVAERLSCIKGLEVRAPDGAFYAFPQCGAFIGRETPEGKPIADDTALAAYLLKVGKVATVPGAAFGLEPYIRISFATSRGMLETAMARIAAALAALH